MDVTFFENEPFYPKTSIQGENWSTDQFQFWVPENPTIPLSSSLPSQTADTLPVPVPETTTFPIPENNSSEVPPAMPKSTTQSSKEVMVYSRNRLKRKPEKPPQKKQEDNTPAEQNQELDQDPSDPNSQPGNNL